MCRQNLTDISDGSPINGTFSMVFQNKDMGFKNSDAGNPGGRIASYTGIFRSMRLQNW